MTRSDGRARVVAVLLNLRGMALLAIGPAVGIGLGAAIFGLPRDVELMAAGMFVLSLGLVAILARAEWRSLARQPPPVARFGGEPR